MRRTDHYERIVFSVLDRLLHPHLPDKHDAGLRHFKASVLRDLESLLNTRRRLNDLAEGMEDVSRSVVGYGLPDLSSFGVGEALHRELLRDAIDEAIRVFEPRLCDVNVYPVDTGGDEGSLRFIITANLIVNTSPEPVSFDTRLELSSGEYKVREG